MNKEHDVILVSGATGQQGGAVAHELLHHGYRVRIMTRKPQGEAAKALAALGASVVEADLDDAASLGRALDGAWGAFAVQNTWEAGVEREEVQGKRFARIARERDVQHFVYSSVGSAHRHTGIPHFDNKWRIEGVVRELGFPSTTVLRPVFFMDNWISGFFKPALDVGQLAIGMKPETRLQMVAVTDIGTFGRIAFERHAELNGEAIDLAGDERTGPETAAIFSEATGRKITFFQVPIAEVRKGSEEYALMLEWFDRVGYDVDIPALERRFGVKMTTLPQWASRTFGA
jgi:uncharacterized protein YbjT (DUF2867 family)